MNPPALSSEVTIAIAAWTVSLVIWEVARRAQAGAFTQQRPATWGQWVGAVGLVLLLVVLLWIWAAR